MQIKTVFLLVLSIFNARCEDEDIPIIEGNGGTIVTGVEDDVLILTKENFDLQVSSKEIILVEFYAPWCGHCKALEPEFAKAAKILKEQEIPVFLAKVDATIESELAKEHDVNGFPTLFVFKKGQKIPYDGPRTAMGIVEYMNERANPNWKPPPEAVITLTKENFTSIISSTDLILVEFYAPWCGHCQRLAPEYERAAKILKDLASPIPLAKVDATVENELAKEYEATGYPTLLIFRRGSKYQYEGPRDEPGIVSYMKEQAKPASQEKHMPKELSSAIGKIDPTVVGFFNNEDDTYRNFISAANSLRGKFTFFHTFNPEFKNQYSYEQSLIIVYQPEIYHTEHEPKRYHLRKDNLSDKEIVKYVESRALPLVAERSPRNRWMFENKYPLVVVYYDVDFSFDHRTQTQLIRKEVAKVAKDYKKKITFAVSNEGAYEDELDSLNLSDSGEDVNVGFYESQKVRYRMEPVEDFSADDLREFVEDVMAGNIPRHIKSQPPPKSNKGPVLTVVGSTFDKLVTESDKNILLEFYAPWCGHCKKLEPIYKKLGKTFENSNKVVIAKIDATANDYPSEFEVSGFPTIFFIPADNKNDIQTYNGERDLKDLVKFVNDQLSKPKDEL